MDDTPTLAARCNWYLGKATICKRRTMSAAMRSAPASAKAGRRAQPDGTPLRPFQGLLDHLATLTRNTNQVAGTEARRAGSDRSAIVVKPFVTLSGFPDEVHRYEVNGRSALAWLIDRYRVTTDVASGIVNDPNHWSEDAHYIVDLVARIVRVALESVEIVDGLPALGV